MIENLNEFIKHLSIQDTKTLSQKVLKTTEELGELAKVVLPFENAPGTLHRFTERSSILENVIDVHLSAISIAHSMGFTEEEINEMLHRKAKKWSGLQSNEENIKFPLPYEIHVTVKRPNDLETFKEDCKEIGVKPIVIDLERDGETVLSDVMTSSVHFGDNKSASEEAERIKKRLENPPYFYVKYTVLRVKIETVPWHPVAPTAKNGFKMKEDNYFESHLRIVTTSERRELLEKIADLKKAHLSRNFFKKVNDNEYIIMMTLRWHKGVYENFKMEVDTLKILLENYNFEVDKTEIEFCLYDSNHVHDAVWIK